MVGDGKVVAVINIIFSILVIYILYFAEWVMSVIITKANISYKLV